MCVPRYCGRQRRHIKFAYLKVGRIEFAVRPALSIFQSLTQSFVFGLEQRIFIQNADAFGSPHFADLAFFGKSRSYVNEKADNKKT